MIFTFGKKNKNNKKVNRQAYFPEHGTSKQAQHVAQQVCNIGIGTQQVVVNDRS